MKYGLRLLLFVATVLLAAKVVAAEPTEQDLMMELMPLMQTAQQPDLATVDGLLKKYGHLKKGREVAGLLAFAAGAKMEIEGTDKGIAFVDSIVSDTSYDSMVRQMVNMTKLMPAIDSKDMTVAEQLVDETIAIDPNSELAAQKAMILQQLQMQIGQ